MARGGKQIEGQLSFEMSLDVCNFVCQANALVGGKQTLKLNSAKLVRSAIMQVVRDDEELKPYVLTIPEFAKLLNIPKNNIYRDIEDITNDIIKNPVYIKQVDSKKVHWVKIPWVSRCEYLSDVGIAIKLNDELKPYLIKLKDHYTQYPLDNILAMKSVYGIRIFELIQEKCVHKNIPKNGTVVELSVQEIRECCDCEERYEKFSHFKSRVLDVAVKEIERTTLYRVNYDYVKTGKQIDAIRFHLNLSYH